MNAADLSKSPRLQRAYNALRVAGSKGLTTLEIHLWTDGLAINSIVAELRQNIRASGLDVECKYDGRSKDGGRVYRYRLVEERAA